MADRSATGVVIETLHRYLDRAELTLDRPIGPETLIVDVGADSIGLLQIHGLLEEKTGHEIPASAMFEHPSVGELAGYLASLS